MKKYINVIFVFLVSGVIFCQDKEPVKMVSFENYQIHIHETGQGEPTVIIEAALGSTLAGYHMLQTAISKHTRVVSYDRPGLGKSTKSQNPRTIPVYVKELKMLLKKENIKPPYILLGHSLGVNIIRYYTNQFQDEVVGLVLVDGCPDNWFDYFKANHTKEEVQMFEGVMDNYKNELTGTPQEEWEQEEYDRRVTDWEVARGFERA